MDPKVCGKLLTTHRRGLGDDVEALRVDSPSGEAPVKAPRWDLADTEGCCGGNSFLWCYWMFLGYRSIYRWRKYVGGAMRGPREGGARPPPGGTPGTLVAASFAAWRPLQVSWFAFVLKRSLPSVSSRLDSVWYSFSSRHWNRQKNSNSAWASG